MVQAQREVQRKNIGMTRYAIHVHALRTQCVCIHAHTIMQNTQHGNTVHVKVHISKYIYGA